VIVADAATWAAYLRGDRNSVTDRLDLALEDEEDVAIIDETASELLPRIRDNASFRAVKGFLLRLPVFSTTLETRVQAAALERKLRSKRVRVTHPLSCLISRACIEVGAEGLSIDDDYRKIARHSRLRLTSC